MDDKNPILPPDNDDWFDSLLKKPQTDVEIGPDEQAISGLPELSDMEFEKIMQEAMSDDWLRDEIESLDSPLRPEEEPSLVSDDIPVYTDEAESAPEMDNVSETASGNTDEDSQPVRKVRPRRKKGYGLLGLPHLVSVAIWLAIAVSAGASLGRLLWICATDVLAFGRTDQAITITITESDTMESITKKLHNAGLIKYPQLFSMYAELSNAEEDISVGTFTLNTLFDYHALVGAMSSNSSLRQTVEVMIPEGYNCAQMFALLEEKGVCSSDELKEYAANGELQERWFLSGLKRGDANCLEGFLFPDTYEFYTNDTPGRVIGKMLDNFENRLKEDEFMDMLSKLNVRLSEMMASHGYDQNYISKNLMDLQKIVTLASIVEKETAGSVESYAIASVFYNRLTYQAAFPYLNSDATVYYALALEGIDRDGKLTAEDIQLDSPYNTYNHQGLPPAAICNPSLASLYAALDPDNTSYYFFIYDAKEGKHQFSSTLQEHQEWIDKLGVR